MDQRSLNLLVFTQTESHILILRDLEATIDFIALSLSNAMGKGGESSTNYTSLPSLLYILR